ncbi:uncharacterized protein LOC133722878 [Rosa rugosa]|uniref:uncharacterized protein LOC133722878 n=1 Tax=Rosa rugosa TaxID=74645 RepID=UPI002B414458|nr:uncharacterized protein LOC133722878 [Rosa rugosa]
MKSMLDAVVISPTQSAFVPGQNIHDNVIAAFETVHSIRRNAGRGETNLILKLDISKAYDRVEWLFLEKIMLKLGFAEKWVQLIMRCVCSTSFSVLWEGQPTGFFRPSRDDSLVFAKVEAQEVVNLKQILLLYESAEGKKINVEKSAVAFGPGGEI